MVRKTANFEENLKYFVTNMKEIWREFEVDFSVKSGFIAAVNLPKFKTIQLKIL